MTLPQELKHLAPVQQAMLIHAAECDLAETTAWSRQAGKASDRVRMQASITRQKKALWQAKHGR